MPGVQSTEKIVNAACRLARNAWWASGAICVLPRKTAKVMVAMPRENIIPVRPHGGDHTRRDAVAGPQNGAHHRIGICHQAQGDGVHAKLPCDGRERDVHRRAHEGGEERGEGGDDEDGPALDGIGGGHGGSFLWYLLELGAGGKAADNSFRAPGYNEAASMSISRAFRQILKQSLLKEGFRRVAFEGLF